jgi:hypothetical protein
MTSPTGGEQGPYRGTPDYPTTQFQAIRPDQPPPGRERDPYPRDPYPREQYQPDPYQREPYQQDPYQRERDERERAHQQELRRPEPREDYVRAERRDAEGRRPLPWGWLVPIAVLLVAAAAAGGYYFGHTKGKKDAHTNAPRHYLSHTSVESYISQHYSAANVQCYGGQDMPLTANSAFTCTAAGASFVVIVKNPDTGSYQVLKAS